MDAATLPGTIHQEPAKSLKSGSRKRVAQSRHSNGLVPKECMEPVTLLWRQLSRKDVPVCQDARRVTIKGKVAARGQFSEASC